MRRSTPWSSRHRNMLPHAGQLIAVWGFYLILLLAELSAAQSLFDISQGQVCDTEACKERAKMILASMNQTEDPCADFYEYACGNWTKTHEIPDDKSNIGNFQILGEKVKSDVKHILLNATYEEGECQNATNKAILAYRVCVCETANETAKFKLTCLSYLRRMALPSGQYRIIKAHLMETTLSYSTKQAFFHLLISQYPRTLKYFLKRDLPL
uniref:Putative peptidase family m13 includes neprilysin n=1 Tax=Ixodes ricinus TaxID=34613 RepID=A0A0K8R7Z1_IXORI